MARGSVIRRCRICRRLGKSGFKRCVHKEAVYVISYRIGNKQIRETIGPNKKDAERILNQRISEINNGSYFQPKEILFKDYIEKWLEDYARPRIKEQTHYKYRNTIKCHITPVLGKYPVTQITQRDIESLMAKIHKVKSPKTANNVLVLLKTMFKYAKRWGYIRENPASEIDNFKVDRKEMDRLEPRDINLLLQHAEEPFKTLFLTAILTGMRKSELFGLKWGDIDWNENIIHVRRSLFWQRNKRAEDGERKWDFSTTKSRYSVRKIVMSPKLKQALQIHQINSPVNSHDLVFTNKKGNPLDSDNLTKRAFSRTLRFAGMRKIRFHDLRHTYCSLLIAQGENLKFIQSQLGHASITTTIDRYGHLLPVDAFDVGSRIDETVFGPQNQVKNLKVKSENLSLSNL